MQKAFIGLGVLVVVLVIGLYALSAYIYNEKQVGQSPSGFYNPWGTTPEEYVVIGTFSGTLPCGDCSGIETTLTLTQYGMHIAEGTYELTEHKKGKTQTTKTLGNWTTLRGTNLDSNATVYQLNPDGPNRPRYFLRLDDDTIQTLDDTGNVQGAETFLLHRD